MKVPGRGEASHPQAEINVQQPGRNMIVSCVITRPSSGASWPLCVLGVCWDIDYTRQRNLGDSPGQPPILDYEDCFLGFSSQLQLSPQASLDWTVVLPAITGDWGYSGLLMSLTSLSSYIHLM